MKQVWSVASACVEQAEILGLMSRATFDLLDKPGGCGEWYQNFRPGRPRKRKLWWSMSMTEGEV